ncbi:MAG: hypothetical protein AB8B48_19600, partial [Pseudomonadales bacterium]
MVNPSNPDTIVPTARLQVIIDADANVRMLQHRLAPKLDFGVNDLDMIAAASAGKISDLEEGLEQYLDLAGADDVVRQRSKNLARRLLRQDRFSESKQGQLLLSGGVSPLRAELPDKPLMLKTPCAFIPCGSFFEMMTHDGVRLPGMTSVEVFALAALVDNPVLDDAVAAQAETLGDRALTKEQYVSMLEPLFAHRFVVERVERDGLS